MSIMFDEVSLSERAAAMTAEVRELLQPLNTARQKLDYILDRMSSPFVSADLKAALRNEAVQLRLSLVTKDPQGTREASPWSGYTMNDLKARLAYIREKMAALNFSSSSGMMAAYQDEETTLQALIDDFEEPDDEEEEDNE